MNSKDSFDKEQYDKEYSILKNDLTVSKNRTNYLTWLKDTQDNFEIKDYRSEKY